MMRRLAFCMIGLGLLFSFFSCGTTRPEDCQSHVGGEVCKICSLDYFDALTDFIRDKADEGNDSVYYVALVDDNGSVHFSYDEKEESVTVSHLRIVDADSYIFVLKMTSCADNCEWAYSDGVHMMNGDFWAPNFENSSDLLPVSDMTYPEASFEDVQEKSITSLKHCLDSLAEFLKDHPQNLSIQDLGFSGYRQEKT